jgi:uncharacterized protein (DUF4415 family)
MFGIGSCHSERPTAVSKRNLKLLPSDPTPAIEWAAVDDAPLVDASDADSPELTSAEAAQLRPLGEVLPMFSTRKTRITIKLDDAVLQAYKARAGGHGYQTLINETLRRGLQADAVKEALREVIREELHPA